MKKRILIACSMQMDMIRYVIKKYEIDIPVIWLDRRLHNDIKNLHCMIQKQINENQDAEEILLSYGLCGNAVLGLYSAETKLILPAFDDCICQMLYREREGMISNSGILEKGCYYLTREWTMDRESIVSQCEQIYREYGKEDGKQMIQQIYNGYHSLVILETGAYDIEKIKDYAKKAAEYTGLRVKIQIGSCKIMEKLLQGNYDDTIYIFQKKDKVCFPTGLRS